MKKKEILLNGDTPDIPVEDLHPSAARMHDTGFGAHSPRTDAEKVEREANLGTRKKQKGPGIGALPGEIGKELAGPLPVNESLLPLPSYSFLDTGYLDFSTREKFLKNMAIWAESGCGDEHLGAFLNMTEKEFRECLGKDPELARVVASRRMVGKARVVRRLYELSSTGMTREIATWIATLQEIGTIPKGEGGFRGTVGSLRKLTSDQLSPEDAEAIHVGFIDAGD